MQRFVGRFPSSTRRALWLGVLAFIVGASVSGCADGRSPSARSVNIPAPTAPQDRTRAFNETAESVMIVPLRRDVLIPKVADEDPLPKDEVGPFELRNETLAASLQLILDGYDVPMAFETDKGLTQRVTVSNLRGPLDKVVQKVCSLANLYCQYNDGILTLKETQSFTVSLPPLDMGSASSGSSSTSSSTGSTTGSTTGGSSSGGFGSIATGLQAITGTTPVVDSTTRTMLYTATARTAERAKKYFERLRSTTAMIVYETYIWEVALNGGNSAGINWDKLQKIGKFHVNVNATGSVSGDLGTPISIGLPTVGATPTDILQFISQQGATKTISQPQISMISGTSAQLKVVKTVNYVKSLTRSEPTTSNSNPTISTEVSSVDTGLTLNINSSWSDSTVYGNVSIEVNADPVFKSFSAGSGNTLSLPEVASRNLSTQIRVRPGDTVLIAGIVSETQRDSSEGIGTERPWIPTDRTLTSSNSELVFMLRPRVIVFKPEEDILAERQQDLAQFNPVGSTEATTSAQTSDKSAQTVVFDNTTPLSAVKAKKALPAKASATKTQKTKAKPVAAQSAPAAAADKQKKIEPILNDAAPASSDMVHGGVSSDLLNPARSK